MQVARKMSTASLCLCLLIALQITILSTEARYLPTRSGDDRLDKLRELLRDLIESEIQRPLDCNTNSIDRTGGQIYKDLGLGERKRYFKRDINLEDK